MLEPGTIVAGYRIDDLLGAGGMGAVYKATQLSLNRVIALKILAAELSEDPGFRERFKREGQLQAGLDHLHIVTVYEAGQTEQGLFLAMRLIPGSTLKDLILSRQLEPRRSLRLLSQVAEALDAAHKSGLIHRDVKPQNILVGERDHAYLADFGLTKAPDDVGLTGTGQFIGTTDYVAPEQIRGERATGATDIYALAGVLCECLTGAVPFPRPTEAATLRAHMLEPPPRLSERRPDLPPAIDDVVARGLAKDPAQRPASAADLVLEATRTFAATAPTGQATRPAAAPAAAGEREATRAHDAPTVGSPTVLASAAAPTRAAATRAAAAGPAWTRWAIVAALAAAVAAGGFLAGHSGSSGGGGGFANSASAGDLELSFPNGWARAANQPQIPGLNFSQPLVLAPARSSGTLVAGQVSGSGPALLPASFRALLASTPAPTDAVSLGGLQAYRYSGLRVKGLTDALTVYVVPTLAGVATLACEAPATAVGFLASCERVVSTLRITGTTALPLGPSASYARLVSGTFARLNASARAAAQQLTAARTPAAQADAATKLAQAYTQAASSLGGSGIDPVARDANSALAASMRRLATAYSAAAAAARSSNGGAYRAASSDIGRAASALSAALASLRSLGYTVAG